MIRRDANRVIGTITLGRQCFEIRAYPAELITLAQYLITFDGLILTAPGHDPLVVLRLGDLLRERRLRGKQQDGPKTLREISGSVYPSEPRSESTAYTAKRQGRPSARKGGDR